jgi:hypothetical protein
VGPSAQLSLALERLFGHDRHTEDSTLAPDAQATSCRMGRRATPRNGGCGCIHDRTTGQLPQTLRLKTA